MVADLARALGDLPDPRPRFVFPARFVERLELPTRAENAMALAFAARRLVATLCGWLVARAAGISECRFEFAHPRGARQSSATRLSLGFSGATRNPERINRVLIEHLQRLALPAAVEGITLRAEAPEALSGRSASLFDERGGEARGASVAVLAERLQARLGKDSVHGLSEVAEHRPEMASQRVAPKLLAGQKSPLLLASGHLERALGPRPLWLLARPQPLYEAAGRPQYRGHLRLLAGPERIESGWWDAAESDTVGDVRRDYFVAISSRAEWLWIFRSQAGWFLHGLFA